MDQHLFQTERGRAGLAAHRRELCRVLWRQWSPDRRPDEALVERTAAAFDNPDFVDVVVHAQRHALGTVARRRLRRPRGAPRGAPTDHGAGP